MSKLTDKDTLRSLAPEGFSYLGYWDKLYHYQKQLDSGEYVELKANTEDVKNGHIKMMAERGYSRA